MSDRYFGRPGGPAEPERADPTDRPGPPAVSLRILALGAVVVAVVAGRLVHQGYERARTTRGLPRATIRTTHDGRSHPTGWATSTGHGEAVPGEK